MASNPKTYRGGDATPRDGTLVDREPTMAERAASYDWRATPLGPMKYWPEALKIAYQIMISSRFPMFIWWGPEFINLYNDAYVAMLGKKHPAGFGKPAAQVWYDIWDVVGPQADLVINQQQATWNEEMLLVMERHGYGEETYFTWSYSPISTSDGSVAGLYCAVTEDTSKVIGRRRLKTVRELASETADLRTVPEAFAAAREVLARNPHDIPFALLYEVNPDGLTATLAASTGVTESNGVPAHMSLDSDSNQWGLNLSLDGLQQLANIGQYFSEVPRGPWPSPPTDALILPLGKRAETEHAGFLIAGISRYSKLDDDYRGFLTLVAGHIATALANSRVYESERRRAEALAEIDRAKTTFFSNISHEFRTPLTLMIAPLEDLRDDSESLSPHHLHRVETAHRNSLRLLKLVNALLDFARIEAGRIEAVYEPTDLAALTKDVASVFRSAVERAGLELVIDTPALAEPVYVDREMWEKIVLNLLSNAFKFTFEGEIRVTLRIEAGSAQLVVSDTGTGIPAQELSEIFERFHRVRDARGRSIEGSGIGLALIEELVKLHGGSVSVESEPDRGSRFTVSIPLGKVHLPPDRIGKSTRADRSTVSRAEAFIEEALRMGPLHPAFDEIGPAQGEEPLLESRTATGVRQRVLFADDNADMRAYAGRLLSRDYDVVFAADGAQALDLIHANPPDLILSDIMMPRLDGYGLLRAMRADVATREIPVILLTARAGEDARIQGLQTGADDYLTKPFSARELLARVQAALKLQQVRGESNRALRDSERRLSRLVEGLTRLHDVGRELSDTVSEAAGLIVILQGMLALHQTGRGVVFACGPENGQLAVAVRIGFDWDVTPDSEEVLIAPARLALETNQAVIIDDIESDAEFEHLRAAARQINLRGSHIFPLLSQSGECLAVLSVIFDAAQHADDLQRRLADMHVRQAADVIARVRAGTALRESEHQYRTLFNSMDEGFCTVEVRFDAESRPMDYRFLDVNAAFERQTGIREAKGRWMREIAPTHEEHWFTIYGRIALTGVPERFESEAKQLGRWYDVYAFRVGNPELRRVAIVFNDITDRRRREEQLRQANKDLEQFAYSASHDLQEPIRNVRIYSELLTKRHAERLNDEALQFLEYVRAGADRMSMLVRDLLAYTQVVKLGTEYELSDSQKAFQTAVLNLDRAIQASSARVTAQALPMVVAHHVHLQQLFQNLISNAIKYRSADRAPEIRVSAEPDGQFWKFSIADNGIGIDEQYREQIFGLFKRLHTADEYSGTGIGLAICQRIVERYSGRIGVTSELGRGSTFWFTLPAN